jgi:uncharacterized membrane protein YphA (DoxX/SURF4 family)
MLDPVIGSLIVGCFVLLFISAATHKLRDLNHFAEVFAGYGIAPLAHRRWLSRLVPLLEIIAALGLLVPASRAAAAAAGAVLLLSYAAAIAHNLRAGRAAIDCGCGGLDQRRPIAAWMVWRNLILAALLAPVCLPWSTRPLDASDAITIGAGTAAAAFLYMSFDALLGRQAAPTALIDEGQ